MNVRPKNYAWPEFYDHVIDLTRYTFSWRGDHRSGSPATKAVIPRWMNVVRAVSSEGFGRIRHYSGAAAAARHRPAGPGAIFDQETTALPDFYTEQVKRDLGPLWRLASGGRPVPRPQRLPERPRAGRGSREPGRRRVFLSFHLLRQRRDRARIRWLTRAGGRPVRARSSSTYFTIARCWLSPSSPASRAPRRPGPLPRKWPCWNGCSVLRAAALGADPAVHRGEREAGDAHGALGLPLRGRCLAAGRRGSRSKSSALAT